MDIINLTALELKKILKTNIAKIGIILAVIIMGSLTIMEYKDVKDSNTYESSTSIDWREREEFLLSQSESLLNDPFYSPTQVDQIQKRLDIAKFRLENNISKDYYKTAWWFFNDNSFNWVFRFIILIVAIVGVFNITMEYDKKTINFWAVSPYKRSKILSSKYLATLVYSSLLISIVFIMGLLSGIVIHGFSSISGSNVLYGISGPYVISIALYSIIIVLLKIIKILFVISLIFMIGVVLKSISFSTIVSIITIFIISPVILYAGKINNFLNYLPFNHLDFRKFLDFGTMLPEVNTDFSSIVIQGFSPVLAGIIVAAYIGLFMAITYTVFCKRDI